MEKIILYLVFAYVTDENSLQTKVLLLMYIIICSVCTQDDSGICKCRFSCVWSSYLLRLRLGNESVPNTQMKGELVYWCLRFAHTWITPRVAMGIILTEHVLQQLHFVLGWLKLSEIRSHNESLKLATTADLSVNCLLRLDFLQSCLWWFSCCL